MNNGETFTVNLIFDNGGTTAVNQTWTRADLKCVVWYMNNDSSRVFAQDVSVATSNVSGSGQITTDATGAMTTMLSSLGVELGGAGAGTFYTTLSPAPVEPYWAIPKTGVSNAVFIAGAVPGVYTDDFETPAAASGISVDPTRWRPVEAFGGFNLGAHLAACAGTNVPAPRVSNVPAVDTPLLALLGMAAAGLGALRLRKRRASA